MPFIWGSTMRFNFHTSRILIFSHLPTVLLALALGFSLTACDFFLKHQSEEQPDSVELKADSMTCLRGVPQFVRLYLNDKASASQVHESFDCLRSTIEHFEKFTRGKTRPDWYGADELLSFLNEVLNAESRVSPEFMREVLKFKTLALGGTPEGMSIQEIRATKKLMDLLERGLVKSRGHIRYLLFQGTDPNRTLDQEKRIQEDVKNSILEILQLNPKGSQQYSFSDFQLLVEQFNIYLGEGQVLAPFLRWFPFSQSIKSVFVGSDPELDDEKAWFDYVQWGMRAYAIALDFNYHIRTLSYEKPAHWEAAIAWVNNIFDWIDVSPAISRKGSLSMVSINEVLKEVMRSGLFKAELDSSLVIETACRAVLNLFDGPAGHRRQCFELESLSTQHYRFLKFEWNAWVLSQKQINQVFEKRGNSRGAVTWGEFKKSLNSYDPNVFVNTLKIREGERKALLQTYQEWRQTINRKNPVVWGPEHRVLVKDIRPTDAIGFNGMSVANGVRSTTRFILRGYGEGTGTNIYNFTISEASFQNIENDFQQIGVAIRFLDSRNGSSAKRTFKEANYLTFSGDGNDKLSAQELFEVINILASAGHQIANNIYAYALAKNCATNQVDQAFGKQYLRKDCFLEIFSEGFSRFFHSAPGLVSLRNTKDLAAVMKEMDQDLIKLSRSEFSVEDRVEYSEIRTMVAVLLYAEVLRVVYDENQDLKLSEAEIRKAAPRFKPFIEQQSPFGSYGTEGIFTCLVFGQRKPGFNWTSAGCLVNSIFGYDTVNVTELVKVLAVLKQDMVK